MAKMNQEQKLIVAIIKRNNAKKVVKASKRAGAKGSTTFLGEGFRLNEKKRILGIPVERERELILTLVSTDIYPAVLEAIIDSVGLDQPRQGIGFIIDTKQITGARRMISIDSENKEIDEGSVNFPMKEENVLYDLIVTIVNKGDSEKVVDATQKAGAEGGTILHGRGTGIHEQAKLFNILIEPEKELVLTLISRDKTNEVLETINIDAELIKPGKGIAFVLEVEKTVGINRFSNKMVNERMEGNK